MTWKNYKYRFVPWILSNFESKTFEKSISEELYSKIKSKFTNTYGFWLEKGPSLLPNGGQGVLVSHGDVAGNTVVGLYPGTIYRSGEPIFLQSIRNSFIFRCADGTLIDGNDRGLSKMIFRSCTYRNRMGPHLTSDMTWLSQRLISPLNSGQYVNNGSLKNPANVMYQEVDLPLKSFPWKLRKFIPNVPYSNFYDFEYIRLVALVSTREIACGEELYSTYFTYFTMISE